jgi:bilirubin oxidase
MFLKAWQLVAISSFFAGVLSHPLEQREEAPVEETPAEETPGNVTLLADDEDWESPEYTLLYRTALPIPPVKQPKMVTTNPVSGVPIHYYEVEIKPFQQQVYPTLKRKSKPHQLRVI